MFPTWLPWRIARLTVSPVRSASSSNTGGAARARSSAETTEPARRTRPYPRRYFSVLGFCSTRPCSWSVDNSRKTVDLCTSSRRARSVTRISGSLPRSLRISSARSSDCTLLRVTNPVLMAQQLYRESLGLASPVAPLPPRRGGQGGGSQSGWPGLPRDCHLAVVAAVFVGAAQNAGTTTALDPAGRTSDRPFSHRAAGHS